MKNFKIAPIITDRKDASLKLYFRDVSKLSLINSEKENELAKKAKAGDSQAINQLIKANLRFVITVAKQYQGKGLDLVDLIQEGNYGMLKAAQSFDPNKHIKFISYAVWWIRQSIMKAISDQCRTIRIPANKINQLQQINKAIKQFEQENYQNPNIAELSDYTNIDENQATALINANTRTISLETPIKDEDAFCLLDIISNNDKESDSDITSQDLAITIKRVINKLSSREQDILRMTFGIDMDMLTNEEIAMRFGITKERVRQLLQNILEKVRNNYGPRLKKLL